MSSAHVTTLTADNFEAFIKTDKPVLVDFWAPWCGPCSALTPEIEALAAEMGTKAAIGKVDVDNNGPLTQRFGIRSIPTLIILHKGQIVEQTVGYASKEDLKAKLEALISAHS